MSGSQLEEPSLVDVYIHRHIKAMTLLKAGVPWTDLQRMTEEDVSMMYEIQVFIAQKEAEQYHQAQVPQAPRTNSFYA